MGTDPDYDEPLFALDPGIIGCGIYKIGGVICFCAFDFSRRSANDEYGPSAPFYRDPLTDLDVAEIDLSACHCANVGRWVHTVDKRPHRGYRKPRQQGRDR